MQRYRRYFGLLILAGVLPAVTACGRDPGSERLEGREAPPAAAMLSPRQGTVTLADQLDLLLSEMEAGMAGDPDRLLRAEAITDGLMEARRRFDWLGTGYDVEARLRQLQAMADRVVAKLRRGAVLAEVEEDVGTLARAVTDLRHQMATTQGGPAPPLLDSLLQQDPMANARVGGSATLPPTPGATQDSAETEETPPPSGGGGPLGRPVQDAGGG